MKGKIRGGFGAWKIPFQLRCRMDNNKLKVVYLKGYQKALLSLIENLQQQEAKVSAEIERSKGEED